MRPDMDERWKTAEARSKTAAFNVSGHFSRFIDQLRDVKGTLHYNLRGEGSMRDVGQRPPGGRQPQEPRYNPQQKRELEQFERKVDDLEKDLRKLYNDAREIDKILNG